MSESIRILGETFEALEQSILAVEGLLEIITPYTTDEGVRGTLRREDVAWALTPAVSALRQTLDEGWQHYGELTRQAE
ncbi:hypothetical protein EBQ34_01100 [Vandammella animalimorsus]|uniref:Uncharacterized protein n=1 Tax=Vandammella animalimorsus TaxID=2029117 RepID=A0A3M6RUU0_9BURK|nr:hypothetical protein [Vandammella animalimorsus]RMX18982.1 hypothetical protein EBQ34_01100 [Vandammella animalimorsus]